MYSYTCSMKIKSCTVLVFLTVKPNVTTGNAQSVQDDIV